MEGMDLSSAMLKTWKALAASESRLHLMTELGELNVGFADVEQFNLGLNSKFRSNHFQQGKDNSEGKLIKVAMDRKMRDERKFNLEMNIERNRLRKELEKVYEKNSKPYRSTIKFMRNEAHEVKEESKENFASKIEHLRGKFRIDEEEKLRNVPNGLESFQELSIFSPKKFAKIERQSYEVEVLGDVSLTEEEKCVLRQSQEKCSRVPQTKFEVPNGSERFSHEMYKI